MKNLILVLLVLISISGNAQRFSNSREYKKYTHNTRLAPRHQIQIHRKSVVQIFLERRRERLERRRDNCYTQHHYRGRIY